VRFGDRLSVKIDVAEDAWTARVPAMVLQPLVENAIRHAVAPRERGGHIEIGATIADGGLRLWVADDGPGLHGNGNGNGIGLANTRERLHQLYGSSHRFELRAANGSSPHFVPTSPFPLSGLQVVVDLPLRV
jgi:two-component system, LytTR family, sensor kinase